MQNRKAMICSALLALTMGLGERTSFADCGAAHTSQGKQAMDIVQTAVSAGQFQTLASALTAAGLVDDLQAAGPFTVFAPTDAAFAKLPAGKLEQLLKPENRQQLKDILLYHVVAGRVGSDKVVNLSSAGTLNGQRVDISISEGIVTVDGAQVVTTDIDCSNGVIHVIDQVVLPSQSNILDTAKSAGMFSTLVAAIGASGLSEALGAPGPFTVFAPTDEAFARLPAGTVEALLKPENRGKLQSILKYHVVAGRVFSDQAMKIDSARTIGTQPIYIRVADGRLRINNATVIRGDIDASNGVIHVIDHVLIPEDEQAYNRRSTHELFHMAIERGVPHFNHGNAAACADIYEVAIQAVLRNPAADISACGRERLMRGLHMAGAAHSDRDRAWALRHALDDVLVSDAMILSSAR